ncbi:hypothetical protein BDV38DRAFT_257885 [Aspergillus pseudotamarii]|uniref:RNAse P Rpr2/Rpp21/SNM1 subunit domain-containing protein n=1 Tax=Aspergillus pseudotamarii TaxID=132259 RepID=A0A5N6SFY4_ASPPS|nr:uncharacterized protein BDV38DRAFT_257885 [Aspergillus pseudotamarii]KAE8133525.1 hypothetical protein BDV38DRAFT_257885 [Aspergillus pseudotamarii]
MPFSDHAPRLGFLKDAASSLDSLSPSTAAHLMTVHNKIFLDESRPLNQRQQEASCGACGSIRAPEWTKTIHIKKNIKHSSGARDGAVVYKCLRCRRRTVKPSRKEPIRPNSSSKIAAAIDSTSPAALPALQHSDSTETKPTSKTADNANSKKRAKARKQGGLQALLASKQQSRASSSLDLFDFLQQ